LRHNAVSRAFRAKLAVHACDCSQQSIYTFNSLPFQVNNHPLPFTTSSKLRFRLWSRFVSTTPKQANLLRPAQRCLLRSFRSSSYRLSCVTWSTHTRPPRTPPCGFTTDVRQAVESMFSERPPRSHASTPAPRRRLLSYPTTVPLSFDSTNRSTRKRFRCCNPPAPLSSPRFRASGNS